MFETLFSDRKVLLRHRQGPLLKERVDYLRELASLGLADSTLRDRALYCLRVACAIGRHPPGHMFGLDEIGPLFATQHDPSPATDKPCRSPDPVRFRATAIEFLGSLGRLRPDTPLERGADEAKLDAFLAH